MVVTVLGSVNTRTLYIAHKTFTGIHRIYTADILFDNENPDIF